jgi:glycosyltransferase involved in cell wall biosynthesis
VSHFQYQRFTERYRIAHKSHVLKNAITPIKSKKKPADTVNLIFHSEPYRGLDILLDALSQIEDEDIRLHVFGDLNTDTIDWKIEFQDAIKERCERDSRVILHGRTSNKKVRKQLQKTHIFAYPSTWRETSCLCLIEALSAGCLCVTSNLTVLPETSMGFANHYEMRYESSQHVDALVPELKSAIKVVRSGFDSTFQKSIIDDAYSWESRLLDWINFSHKIGPAKTG